MNHRMRRVVETLACKRRYGIADEKGAEYSGKGKTYKEDGADTLANFKRVGERRGISAESALMVYLDKHMDSISTAVREANEIKKVDGLYPEGHNPRHVYAAGEGIVSRLDDARNYLDLLECLLIDQGSIAEPYDEEGAAYHQAIGMATVGPTRTSVGDDEIDPPVPGGYTGDTPEGMVEGLDGIFRGPATVDSSVAPGTAPQEPICGPPVPVSRTMDAIRDHRVDL